MTSNRMLVVGNTTGVLVAFMFVLGDGHSGVAEKAGPAENRRHCHDRDHQLRESKSDLR